MRNSLWILRKREQIILVHTQLLHAVTASRDLCFPTVKIDRPWRPLFFKEEFLQKRVSCGKVTCIISFSLLCYRPKSLGISEADQHPMLRPINGFCTWSIYAGTVITSFNHVMIPTRGNWLQTNPLEHESDDRADLCVFYQWWRYGTSAASLINICRCIVVP